MSMFKKEDKKGREVQGGIAIQRRNSTAIFPGLFELPLEGVLFMEGQLYHQAYISEIPGTAEYFVHLNQQIGGMEGIFLRTDGIANGLFATAEGAVFPVNSGRLTMNEAI